MKTPAYLIITLLLLCSGSLFAQTESRTELSGGEIKTDLPADYILDVPRMDTRKVLPVFKDKIKSISSLEFKGFCQSRALLFLHGTNEQIIQVTRILDELGQNYFFKYDVPLEKAMDACESRTEITQSLRTE